MSEWKNIVIDSNTILAETDKASLISMPYDSPYSEYSFWHPAKLIRQGWTSATMSISYTDEFNFTLKKYQEDDRARHIVIDEFMIDTEQFEVAFGLIEADF